MSALEPAPEPAAVVQPDAAPVQVTPPAQPRRIEWGQALPAAGLAAVVSSVLMVVPLGAFWLGMLAAGALSVLLYRRRNPTAQLTPGMGARLGAVGGFIGFGIFAVFSALSALLFGMGAQIRAAITQAIAQAAARNSDPQAQQAIEFFKTPAGMGVVIAAGMALMLVAFLVLASVGGALGAALLRNRERR